MAITRALGHCDPFSSEELCPREEPGGTRGWQPGLQPPPPGGQLDHLWRDRVAPENRTPPLGKWVGLTYPLSWPPRPWGPMAAPERPMMCHFMCLPCLLSHSQCPPPPWLLGNG